MEAECGSSSVAWKVQVVVKTKLKAGERNRNETSQKENNVSEKLSFLKHLIAHTVYVAVEVGETDGWAQAEEADIEVGKGTLALWCKGKERVDRIDCRKDKRMQIAAESRMKALIMGDSE